jgi:flavorubredoxin
MGETISAGLAAEGVPSKLFHAATSDRDDVLTEIFKAGAVIVGSPTLNRGLLTTIAPVLEDLRGIRFKNKIGAAFGCYVWSGECVKIIEERLDEAGITVPAPGVRAKWQPDADALGACEELGRGMARELLKD